MRMTDAWGQIDARGWLVHENDDKSMRMIDAWGQIDAQGWLMCENDD